MNRRKFLQCYLSQIHHPPSDSLRAELTKEYNELVELEKSKTAQTQSNKKQKNHHFKPQETIAKRPMFILDDENEC